MTLNMNNSKIPFINYSVNRKDVHSGIIHLMAAVKPEWNESDIQQEVSNHLSILSLIKITYKNRCRSILVF